MKSAQSLKMRAITLLSQREHSPAELRRKLLRIQADMARNALRLVAADGARAGADADHSREDHSLEDDSRKERSLETRASAEAEVDTLITWLQGQGYLSEARFVESRIHARASRYGSLRIKQELAQHGLALSAENQAVLRTTEAERARAVWQRKFGRLGAESASESRADPVLRAKQIRFLTARGFAPDVVRQVLRSLGED